MLVLNKKGVDQACLYPNVDKGCGDHLTASDSNSGLWLCLEETYLKMTSGQESTAVWRVLYNLWHRLGMRCHWPK